MGHHLFLNGLGRRLLIGIVSCLFLFAGNAYAQKFIGGSIGVSGGINQSTSTGSLQNAVNFTVCPDVGWTLGEKWAAGIRPTLAFALSSSANNQFRSLSVGINPYARFRFVSFRRFGLWAEADPELSLSYAWTRSPATTTAGGNWTPDNRTVGYGIRILPVLTYQLNDHIALEGRLNFFSLAFIGRHTRYPNGQTFDVFTYGLEATTKDVTDTWNNLTIGFLYHF